MSLFTLRQKKCERAVEKNLWCLKYVPDHFKTDKMCEKAAEDEPKTLRYVPDHLKMQEICDKSVKDDSSSLQFVPHWFVTREGLYVWHNDNEYCDGDEDNFFKWYGYKKQKVQKASIREELLPIAWHPLRYWDWCMSADEKQEMFLSLMTRYKIFLAEKEV